MFHFGKISSNVLLLAIGRGTLGVNEFISESLSSHQFLKNHCKNIWLVWVSKNFHPSLFRKGNNTNSGPARIISHFSFLIAPWKGGITWSTPTIASNHTKILPYKVKDMTSHHVSPLTDSSLSPNSHNLPLHNRVQRRSLPTAATRCINATRDQENVAPPVNATEENNTRAFFLASPRKAKSFLLSIDQGILAATF